MTQSKIHISKEGFYNISRGTVILENNPKEMPPLVYAGIPLMVDNMLPFVVSCDLCNGIPPLNSNCCSHCRGVGRWSVDAVLYNGSGANVQYRTPLNKPWTPNASGIIVAPPRQRGWSIRSL